MFYSLETCIKKNNGFFFHDNNNVVELVLKCYDLFETFNIGNEYKKKIEKIITMNKDITYCFSMYVAWKNGLLRVNYHKAYMLWDTELVHYLSSISPSGYDFIYENGFYMWVNKNQKSSKGGCVG